MVNVVARDTVIDRYSPMKTNSVQRDTRSTKGCRNRMRVKEGEAKAACTRARDYSNSSYRFPRSLWKRPPGRSPNVLPGCERRNARRSRREKVEARAKRF